MQGAFLDLPDPFARESEFIANFLESAFFIAIQAETQLEDLSLAVIECLEDFIDHGVVSLRTSILDTLNDREREILELRFGLDGDEKRTLEEIGDKFGLTRERIRQIQERALHKMRVRIEEREAPMISA